MSMTLSKNLTPSRTALAKAGQSKDFFSLAPVFVKEHTFKEPRLQDSLGYNRSSPHGFVVTIGPNDLKKGLYSFILSEKRTPG